MASSDSPHLSPRESAAKVEDLLNSQQGADVKPQIVEESYEKASLQKRLSADADCLSRKNKEEKLDSFLKQRHGRHHPRRRRKLTVKDVKAEAAKILEEFLQAQLKEQDIPTRSPEKRYERYVEANITEETTPSSSSNGYLASVSGMLREDSIPYADDSDHELTKAESLPHDDFMEKYFGKPSDKGLEIIHSKSKSAPYDGHEDYSYRKPRAIGHKAPPPPPPGTPHTPSERGSTEVIDSVPYRGRSTDSSIPYSTDSVNADSLDRRHSIPKRPSPPKAPSTLDLPKPLYQSGASLQTGGSFNSEPHSLSSSSHGKSSSLPVKRRQDNNIHSSDTGDEESDSNNHSHIKGRKKKSMFKKAQERLQTLLRIKGDHSPHHEHSEHSDTKPKHVKRKAKKSKKRKTDDQDSLFIDKDGNPVLGERHVHTTKHIHQTHIGENVYRTEDGTRVVDENAPEGRKHVKIDWNVKESADNEKGIMGRLKRLTSRSDKKHMKGSKSMTIEGNKKGKSSNYNRAVSVPEPDSAVSVPDTAGGDYGVERHNRIECVDDSDGFSVTEIENATSNDQSQNIHVSQVVSRRSDDIRRHSSHLDIVDHMGDMVERIYFDPDEDKFPRNESFDFVSETDVRERRILANGRVKVVHEMDTHERMSITEDEDIEEDGKSEDGPPPLADMSEADKEDLYGKIAERLAMIGDNLTVEREMEIAKSAASSPQSKLSSASGETDPTLEPGIKKVALTQLETEIRDELRMVADQIDARLAADARQAAMRIAGIMTYNHFKNVVQETVGNEPGWAQVAAVFNITKRAIQLAGASGALAMQIKEMSLRYIEDRFANWIVGQGGWDSMLSDNSDDSDKDYSDVD